MASNRSASRVDGCEIYESELQAVQRNDAQAETNPQRAVRAESHNAWGESENHGEPRVGNSLLPSEKRASKLKSMHQATVGNDKSRDSGCLKNVFDMETQSFFPVSTCQAYKNTFQGRVDRDRK